MKKFVGKILLFFLIIGAIDFFYGLTFDYMYVHAKGGENKRIHDLCTKNVFDILIMGSSRAHHHYVPFVIEETTGLSCYNAGFDGNGIILAYGFLQKILERYHPKLVVYDVEPAFDINIYSPDNERIRYLSLQRPFYTDEGVASIFKDIALDEYYKVHSSLYRYNSACITGAFSFFSSMGGDSFEGYEPLFGEMNSESSTGNNSIEKEHDPKKLEYISKFIKLLNNNHIPLLVVASPVYTQTNSEVFNVVKQMCRGEGVRFVDYYQLPGICGKQELFNDYMHMNDRGARLYSKQIGTFVKDYMNVQEIQ